MSFNLTTKKWIPVVTQNWQQKEVSLIELFETWQSYREIKADNPPTTLALYRFLLAIIHRAYMGPKNVDHWEEIKDDNGNQVIEYLQDKKDYFDLFHPEKPFMQTLSIDSEKSEKCYSYLAYELHGANTSTVFCHQHHWGNSCLSFSEAARLILRLQLFDFHGKKTGATKEAGAIPFMDAANILVWRNNLTEILLFNLIDYDPENERPCSVRENQEDLPCWERPISEPKQRIPVGYIDYLTYQWRRLRLFKNEEKVIKVAVHPGDYLPKKPQPIDEQQWECHIAYRKTKKGTFQIGLNLNRSLWRDSAGFLQSSDISNRPEILDWVAQLEFDNLIINLQVIGLKVDNAKPLGWTQEKFSAPIEFVTNRQLWQILKIAIEIAEKYQQIFRSFKRSPYYVLDEKLKHGDAGSLAKSLDGESRYWLTLDQKFTELLYALPQDKQTLADGTISYGGNELPKWTQTVKNSAKNAFTDSIQSIRNYEARANALRTLNYYLKKLEGSDDEDSIKSKKSRKKS
jgi:CRISPR system Cascade subunit CasA